jgi:PST family polysaccharide transporter
MCALLAAYARPAVLVVYGEQWLPAVEALSLLCVLGAVRIFVELGYDFLAATGSSRGNLLLQGVWFIVLVPGLVVGARLDGIRGVAAAHAVIAVAVVLPILSVLLVRRRVDLRSLPKMTWRPLVASASIAGSALAVGRALDSPLAQLLVGVGISGLLAFVLLFPMRRLANEQRSAEVVAHPRVLT